MSPAARRIATLVLFVLAVATGTLAWLLRPQPQPPEFIGPMRSDYTLGDYTLIALDETGQESFSVTGPQLDRDPHTGTFTLDKPFFSFPQAEGGAWEARAEDAWISADGGEVRLTREVEILGAPREDQARMRIESERMTVFPREERATSDTLVTVTDRGSTMSGHGMAVDLATRHLQLHSRSRIRYVPTPR
ncbi:LPS export ABC transporter periplasmic protein LptC [Coralloluteibacterium thermophilus]|uniref:LPS export ABC transporter periplasmic protein LptC n=1 Tax=Coralloluteibacterium thermophilum TaxID=2707049 RepID=A0ABV9NL59_9GAMM